MPGIRGPESKTPAPPGVSLDGLFIIDKPTGCTSHDVVVRVRKLLNIRRVGHGGTLDPEATGVLLVAAGQATRFFQYLASQDKTYTGRIRLGFSTDSYDASGSPTSEEKFDYPEATAVSAAMKNMEGTILQVPPAYSAKKLHGKPVYKLARAGKEFRLKPARVVIKSFRPTDYVPPFLAFEAACSSGTYVRSLAHDLGQALGCGAHLHALRRTSAGPYSVRTAIPLRELEEAAARGDAERYLIPLEGLLPDAPAVVLVAEAVDRIANGSPVVRSHFEASARDTLTGTEASLFRIMDPTGKLRALARADPKRERLFPIIVIK